MTAYNVVRFRVKPGWEPQFLEAHRHLERDFPGLRGGGLVKTGERTCCLVGAWDDMASIAAARPAVMANLNRFRDTLEDLGGGLGVTDPVSGDVVMGLRGGVFPPGPAPAGMPDCSTVGPRVASHFPQARPRLVNGSDRRDRRIEHCGPAGSDFRQRRIAMATRVPTDPDDTPADPLLGEEQGDASAPTSGRVSFDKRGNAVWEWRAGDQGYTRDATTTLIRRLEVADLSLEQSGVRKGPDETAPLPKADGPVEGAFRFEERTAPPAPPTIRARTPPPRVIVTSRSKPGLFDRLRRWVGSD